MAVNSEFPSPGGREYLTTRKHPWILSPTSWLFSTVADERTVSFISGLGFNPALSPRLGFMFRINPVRAEFSQAKMRELGLTKSGYQNTFWFGKSRVISVTGSTGVFSPIPAGGLMFDIGTFKGLGPSLFGSPLAGTRSGTGGFDITKSDAWKNFERLRLVFNTGTDELYVMFTDDQYAYFGSVNNFNFTQDANDPFQIKYSFTFEAYSWYRIDPSNLTVSDAVNRLNYAITFGPTEEATTPPEALFLDNNIHEPPTGEDSISPLSDQDILELFGE